MAYTSAIAACLGWGFSATESREKRNRTHPKRHRMTHFAFPNNSSHLEALALQPEASPRPAERLLKPSDDEGR